MSIKFAYAPLSLFTYLSVLVFGLAGPSVHIHTPPIFQVELEKRRLGGSRWTCFGARVPRTLHCATANLNPP